MDDCGPIAAGPTADTASEVNTAVHAAMQLRHDSPEADPGINLSIAIWNVMGLTAVQEDVQQLLSRKRHGSSLDIIVLKETKLIPQQHGKMWLKPQVEGWSTHLSSKCPPERAATHERNRSGSGGIIIASRNMGLGLDFEEDTNVPECFSDHLAMINSSRLNMRIVGVYMPCNDPQKRTELYDFLASITKDATTAKQEILVAGDWNAAWDSTDRASEQPSTVDQQHRSALKQMELYPFQTVARAKTFGCMLHGKDSRIDDILVRGDITLDKTLPEDVLPIGKRSDNLPLMVSFPIQMPPASHSGTMPPEEDTESIDRVSPEAFCRPLITGQLQKQMLRRHLEGILMNDVVRVANNITAAYAEAKNLYLDTICCHEPGQAVPARAREQFKCGLKQRLITKEKVASLASEVTGLVCQMNKAALDVLPAAPDKGTRRIFRPREMCREYQHLQRERSFLVKRMQKDSQFRHNHESTSEAQTDTAGIGAPHHPAPHARDICEEMKEDMRNQVQTGRQADEFVALPTGT